MNIRDYWRDELKEIREFEAISEVEDKELLDVKKEIENLIDDQFIEIATERGISRREKMLVITPFADDNIDDRRFRVLSRWNEQLPYTYKVLIEKLNQLCGENGYTINLNSNLYDLKIKIELTKKRMFDEVAIMSRKMVPANIVVSVELRYNQHSNLRKLTHRQMGLYKHSEMREVVVK